MWLPTIDSDGIGGVVDDHISDSDVVSDNFNSVVVAFIVSHRRFNNEDLVLNDLTLSPCDVGFTDDFEALADIVIELDGHSQLENEVG